MRNHRIIISSLGIMLLVLSAFMALPRVSPAQDTIEDRVSALETHVADQDERIEELEARLGELEDNESGGSSANEASSGAGESGQSGDTITVSGDGTTVSEKFDLGEGRYKVTATVELDGDIDGFAVWIYVGDSEDLLFNELIDEPGTWTGSAILDAGDGGETFVEVSNTDSSWSLVFEPY